MVNRPYLGHTPTSNHMKHRYTFLALATVMILSSCNYRQYTSDDFSDIAYDQQSIAILPIEIIYMGKKPKNLTDDDIAALIREESLLYQSSLHKEVHGRNQASDNAPRITVQSHRTTVARLADAGIDIESSWRVSPEELADILGVDAVLMGKVSTRRLLTDAESLVIDIAGSVINSIPSIGGLPGTNGRASKSADMTIGYEIIDTRSGATLWTYAGTSEASWDDRPEEIIQRINRRAARRFPYSVGRDRYVAR